MKTGRLDLRLAPVFAALLLWPLVWLQPPVSAAGATPEPRDLVITDDWIGATDPGYENLWIVERANGVLRLAIDLETNPLTQTAPTDLIEIPGLEQSFSPLPLIVRMDPRTVHLSPASRDEWLITTRDRLPYPVPDRPPWVVMIG